jgi:hypothetical protein
VFDAPAGAPAWRPLAGAGLAAVVPFMHTEGWVLWPVLLWVGWRAGVARRTLGVIAACGAVFMVIYFRGLPLGVLEAATAADGFPAALGRRVDYLLTYVGLPLTRADALEIPGRVLGAGLLLAALAVIVRRVVLAPAVSRLGRLSTALLIVGLLPALAAAFVRADEPAIDGVLVPVRYTVLLLPLYVGLWWTAAPAVARWLARARPAAVTAVVAAVGAVALVLQVGAGQASAVNAARIRATIERFEAGETDDAMRVVISEDLPAARRELELMRRAGVYQP